MKKSNKAKNYENGDVCPFFEELVYDSKGDSTTSKKKSKKKKKMKKRKAHFKERKPLQ